MPFLAAHVYGTPLSGHGGRMRSPAAAVGSSLFLMLAPGTVAVLLPWWLTGWRAGHWWLPVRVLGLVPLAWGAEVDIEGELRQDQQAQQRGQLRGQHL